MGSGFDLGFQQVGENQRQKAVIDQQQRVERQNAVGAQLLDAINNAGDIKPQTKDENGNIIHNPEYDRAQDAKAQLLQQYTGLFSPEQHASFADRLHGLIFGHPTPHTQQPALSPNSSPNEPPPPAAAPGQVASSTPAPPPHPMAPLPADHPANKITDGIKALGNHLSAFAHPLTPPAQPDPELIAKYQRDPGAVAAERQQALWGVRGQNALELQDKKNEYLKAMLEAKPARFLSQTTIPDLLKEMQVDPDVTVYSPSGSIISPSQLAEMPPGMIAREFQAGTRTFFALGDANSKTINVGGKIIQVPPIGQITQANSEELGTATGALPKTHQVPGMNPGETVNLTTQPVLTPGMTGGAPVAPAAPVATPADQTPNPTLKTRPLPATPPTLPPSPSQQAITNKTNQGRSQSKQIPQPTGQPIPPAFAKGTMLTQGKSAQPVVSAMSVVAANIFGQNGEKPIWENSWMYDKPELRKALNNALTLNALRIPGSEDESLLSGLKASLGLTQASQEAINDAAVQARKDVERLGGPEALKQFAREAAMQEDLPALRAATKASAAQGSLALAVRSAPVYNISSAQDFRNQLGTLLSTATSSMKGYPAINPEYVKWWERGTAAAKGGPTSSNAPKVPSGNDQVYEMNNKRYTYNGTGKKSDLKNYTEVPSGR